ncbi:MAG: class I SAM-dependent RNA methyltransferase, partial [Planctomycetes bacterium]|nr:class I SAM-dependent RNA methyltransferase [Planctomycetota bacterium]
MNLSAPSTILITCARGLIDYLKQEVEGLGYSIASVHRSSLTIRGTMTDCMKLNLHLRTAFSVRYLLREFYCRDGD